MNILLIQPDISRYARSIGGMFPSLGPNLLATILEQAGHKCCVIDPFMFKLQAQKANVTINEIIIRELKRIEHQVVGISIVQQTRIEALKISQLVKKYDSSIKVVIGGPGAALLAKQYLTHDSHCVDFVVLGEAERTFPKLVDTIAHKGRLNSLSGIAIFDMNIGIPVMKYSKPHPNISNLRFLPIINYERYIPYLPNRILDTVCIMTSRGCLHNCAYCGSHNMWGKPRYRSSDSVVEEIVYLHERYGTINFRIHDDTFGENMNIAMEILGKISKRGLKIRLYAHSRIETVTLPFLKMFRYSGGEALYYGIESGSIRIRKSMGRGTISNKKILNICQMTKEVGIGLGIFIIFGFPDENREDIRSSFDLIDSIRPNDIYCSILKAQLGTPLYERTSASAKFHEFDWLKNDKEYYPYVSGEYEDILKGCEILLYEKYSAVSLRSCYEKNNDLNCLSLDREKSNQLRKKAISYLYG